MIKKLIIIICSILISINVYAKDFNINSNYAILLEGDNVLYEKNSDTKVPIASLTKIMTALVVIENAGDLNKAVTIKKSDFALVDSHDLATASLKEGETLTITDLLYGLMLPSGADAAEALARSVVPNEKEFINLMNKTAEKLELRNTHFSNPVGYDDSNNYSTARDVSSLLNYALENVIFKKIVTTDSYITTNKLHTYNSHIRKNALVGNYLEGGKTGTTNKAGLCLASFAYDKTTKLTLVTLGAPLDYENKPQYMDAKTLYSYYIDNYDKQRIVRTDEKVLSLSVSNSVNDYIDFYTLKDKYLYLPNDFNRSELKYVYTGIKRLDPSFRKGEKLGHLTVLYKDEKIYSEDVYLEDNIKFSYITYIKNNIKYLIIGIGLLLLSCMLVIKLVNKRVERRL